MTASGEFAGGRDFEAPPYPSVFGITFTPIITGALAAILGVGASVFLFVTYVQPTIDAKTALESEVGNLQAQTATAQVNKKKVKDAQANLEKAQQRREDVYALFATEDSLDTLLLDINREFTRPGRRVKLLSFTPAPPALLADESLGPAVKGRLLVQQIAVAMEGDFAQTQALIRSIERLQPLIIIRNLNSTRDATQQKLVVKPPAIATPVGQAVLKTSFTLQVVVTPSPTASPPPSPAAK